MHFIISTNTAWKFWQLDYRQKSDNNTLSINVLNRMILFLGGSWYFFFSCLIELIQFIIASIIDEDRGEWIISFSNR